MKKSREEKVRKGENRGGTAGGETFHPRAMALQSLLAWERCGKYANLEIDAVLSRHSSYASNDPAADRALYTRLVYGVLERKLTLDYAAKAYSDRPLEMLDPDLRMAVRLGLYQMLYMDRIPAFAAIAETVDLLPRSKRGYLNAVLRSFQRGGCRVDLPEGPLELRLSVEHSVPEPLVRHFLTSYGETEGAAIVSSCNREPPLSLRVNTMRLTAEEAALRWGGRLSPLAPDVVRMDGTSGGRLTGAVWEAVENGDGFVQDEASRVASAALGALPGETVVDTCACPGGKTFSLLLDMADRGRLYAFDLHRNKLSLVERGAARLGLTSLVTGENDARCPVEELIGRADRVLCDVPCSGLGVIAKKPDVRYKDLSGIGRLPEVQLAVLTGAAAYLRPGGTLVYSTCTLNPAENEDVVRCFLSQNGESFALVPDPRFGLLDGTRTFFPHRDGCDGFFAAKLRRVK